MDIYDFDSRFNDIDYNIELLDYSSVNDNLFYIAGHSGEGDNCYFNRVIELVVGDNIYIINGNRVILFLVVDKYYIYKDGFMDVDKRIDRDYIYLITCDLFSDDKQLIIEGKLIN